MRVRGLCGVLGVLVATLLAAAPSAHGAAVPIFEKYSVPTVDGASINVEVMRPAGVPNAPVILTYSPYNTLSETTAPNLANDDLGQHFLELGYARAVADVVGTRNSSGCWDYGGPRETQSGVDLVDFLAGQPWSNGNVGMIGGSYDGTTASMVASRGDDVPGLKAIVPIAAIGRWYGYAYGDGVRYAGNSEVPTDEGADTPLAFDFGLTRTPPTDPSDPAFLTTFLSRINPCDSVAHTQAGYDDTPDYNQFWVDRDYIRHAGQFRAAVLIAHGWQDYNVKQEEGVRLFEALPTDDPATVVVDGVPFKRLYMFQGTHGSPDDDNWAPLLDRFFAQTLLETPTGVDAEPAVLSEPRSADEESLAFIADPTWPPPTTGDITLSLGRAEGAGTLSSAEGGPPASYTDAPSATEESSRQQPDAEGNWLFYATGELTQSVRLAGAPNLDLRLTVNRDHAHLTPVLVDIAPDGTAQTVSRGFLNLLYRDGLETAKPLPVDEPVNATVTFKPQDQVFDPGHRIGVIVQSSNTVWAVPDQPGATVTIEHAGSGLTLPIVGAETAAGQPPAALPVVDPIPGDEGPGASSTCRGRPATAVDPEGDELLGTAGDDVIVAAAAKPGTVIRGLAGNDLICGTRGSDRVRGGGGADTVLLGAGRDSTRGGAGRDLLRGGAGRDRLRGGPGRDRCRGGKGRDRLRSCAA